MSVSREPRWCVWCGNVIVPNRSSLTGWVHQATRRKYCPPGLFEDPPPYRAATPKEYP